MILTIVLVAIALVLATSLRHPAEPPIRRYRLAIEGQTTRHCLIRENRTPQPRITSFRALTPRSVSSWITGTMKDGTPVQANTARRPATVVLSNLQCIISTSRNSTLTPAVPEVDKKSNRAMVHEKQDAGGQPSRQEHRLRVQLHSAYLAYTFSDPMGERKRVL
jgi:hypothetical protein